MFFLIWRASLLMGGYLTFGYFVFVDVLYSYLLFKKCFYFEVFKLLDMVFLRFWIRIFTVLRTRFSDTKYNMFDLSTVTSETPYMTLIWDKYHQLQFVTNNDKYLIGSILQYLFNSCIYTHCFGQVIYIYKSKYFCV